MVHRYPELELVTECRKGNPTYQRALYQQYYRKMYGVCLRYANDPDDAQDVLQEGFIRVFKKLDSFRGTGSLEGWIRRIMVHTSIEYYRRKSRYFMVDIEGAAHELDTQMDALAQMSREEILQQIQALPPGYRTVFNLYIIEGFTHQEIGEMLDISEGTSKSQLSRAKLILRDRLSRMDAQAM